MSAVKLPAAFILRLIAPPHFLISRSPLISQDGVDRWHVGFMAGYGNNHSSTRSVMSGYRASGSVEGYSTGGYAT
ncbi:hypothetical protein SZ66_20610 [Pantoea ananatis]|nr:hypothetical protein [Pantoea ananatis]